jgi:hypothetical protein
VKQKNNGVNCGFLGLHWADWLGIAIWSVFGLCIGFMMAKR